jgi:hypothetical protein
MDSIKNIRDINQRNAQMKVEADRASEQSQSNAATQQVLFEAFQAMVEALRGDKTKSEAMARILQILDLNQQALEENKEKLEVLTLGLGTLEEELKALPEDGLKSIPRFLAQKEFVKVSNFDELSEMFGVMVEAIREHALNAAPPVVNVPEPVVNLPAPVVHVGAPIVNVPEANITVPEPKVTTTVVVKDWKRDYAFSDSEKDEKKSYYGYIRPDGQWYIMCLKEHEADEDSLENSTGSARFMFGKKGYQESWKKHESLKFKYLHEAYLE